MKTFLSLCADIVFDTGRACRTIERESPFHLVLIPITVRWLLTWINTLIAFLLGRVPFVEPFVRIPAEDYYFVELFFLIPYGLFLWVFVTGATQIGVLFLNRGSDYKGTLLYFSFTDLVLWPVYGIVDFVTIITDAWNGAIIIPVHTAAEVGVASAAPKDRVAGGVMATHGPGTRTPRRTQDRSCG